MAFYKIHKFKEGGTMLYHFDPSVEAVDVSIIITTGASADGDKPGLTHFVEHMIFCDTMGRTENEIDRKSRELHNNQNAITSNDFVGLHFCTPVRNLEKCMEHNGDILMNSKFPEDKLKREKDVVISEMLMKNNISMMIQNLLNNCYGEDNNILTEALGTEESVRSITRKDLLDYRAKYFNRNNLVICIAGNVSYQDAKDLCKKYIVSKIAPKGTMFIPEVQNVYLRRDFNFLYCYMNNDSSVLQFCFPIVGKQNYKNVVLSRMLDRILYNRIYDNLRQKEGLIYTAASYDLQFANDGLKIIELETANENSNSCMRSIANVIGNLIKEGINEDEFLSIKQEFIDANSMGHGHSIYRKSLELYSSYINNDRIYTDKEKKDIFDFLTVDELNDYMVSVLNTSEVIVNYGGARLPNELYNPQQIEALFLLNRFSPEQLKALYDYDVPDMGCPGEYVIVPDKNKPSYRVSKQLMIEYFEKKKRGRKKKQKKIVTFESLSEDKRNDIKEILRMNGIDIDVIAAEYDKVLNEENQEK